MPDILPTSSISSSDTIHDLDLLRRMRAGDANALSAMYQRHQAALYRFAVLRTGSADTAADIVQDVFMALMEGKLMFDATRGALLSFLFGVARNFALKRDAAGRRHQPLPEDDESVLIDEDSATPIERLLGNERAEAVREALAKLAPHYRDVVILYEMHDLSYVEIANVCNIDIGTVRSRLSRARAKLTLLLAEWKDDSSDGNDHPTLREIASQPNNAATTQATNSAIS